MQDTNIRGNWGRATWYSTLCLWPPANLMLLLKEKLKKQNQALCRECVHMHNDENVCLGFRCESMEKYWLYYGFLQVKMFKIQLKKNQFPYCCRMQRENSLSTDCREGLSGLYWNAHIGWPTWVALRPTFHAVTLLKCLFYTTFRFLNSSWLETFWKNSVAMGHPLAVSAVLLSGLL